MHISIIQTHHTTLMIVKLINFLSPLKHCNSFSVRCILQLLLAHLLIGFFVLANINFYFGVATGEDLSIILNFILLVIFHSILQFGKYKKINFLRLVCNTVFTLIITLSLFRLSEYIAYILFF